MILPDQDST